MEQVIKGDPITQSSGGLTLVRRVVFMLRGLCQVPGNHAGIGLQAGYLRGCRLDAYAYTHGCGLCQVLGCPVDLVKTWEPVARHVLSLPSKQGGQARCTNWCGTSALGPNLPVYRSGDNRATS